MATTRGTFLNILIKSSHKIYPMSNITIRSAALKLDGAKGALLRHSGDVTLPAQGTTEYVESQRRLHTIHSNLNSLTGDSTPYCTYVRSRFECIVDEA